VKNKKIIITVIAVIALIMCFASCAKKPITPPAAAPVLTIDTANLANYSIVRSDDAKTAEKTSASTLAANIEAAIGKKPAVISDFLTAGQTAGEYEILIGETNRAESAEVYAGLKYNDYRITAKGSKIIIAGGSQASLDQAVEYFSSLLTGAKLELYAYEYKATYEVDGLTISGVKASEYDIVYAGESQLPAANIIRDAIGNRTGERLSIVNHKNTKTEYEIVVGATSRYSYDAVEYYNYDIFNDGKCIYINAYDIYALNAAARNFEGKINSASNAVEIADFDYEYKNPTKEELIADIDSLYMRWAEEWTPDPRMLDFDLMIESFKNPTDRLLTCAHRAESIYYPENSLEAIVSFYRMGGSCVEVDIRPTKDGVLVLMHDATLSRMTDWDVKNGKNGLPTSNLVSDWTFEQLQQLCLKEGWGGANATVTSFKIPSLVEALKICKNRLLIVPDKTDQWRYSDKDNLSGANFFLFDAMKEADNYNSILLSYAITAEAAVKVQKQIYDHSGVVAYILPREHTASLSTLKYFESQAMKDSYGIQVGTNFNEVGAVHNSAGFQEIKKNMLVFGWTLFYTNDGKIDSETDNVGKWQKMWDVGYRMIMGNNYLELVKYSATTCNFD